jgi:hypothetical protein
VRSALPRFRLLVLAPLEKCGTCVNAASSFQKQQLLAAKMASPIQFCSVCTIYHESTKEIIHHDLAIWHTKNKKGVSERVRNWKAPLVISCSSCVSLAHSQCVNPPFRNPAKLWLCNACKPPPIMANVLWNRRLSLWPVSMQVMKRKCLYSTAGHASNVLFIIQNQSIRALPVLLPRPQTKN